jgi:NADH:ubiquinone oxidoreductase subunit 2 (subunit N)
MALRGQGDRLGIDDIDIEKSSLAFLGGFGLVGIVGFFYLFMRDKPTEVVAISILIIILSTLTMLFFLLDKLRFSPGFITDRNSNLIAGMLFCIIFLIILISFTEIVQDAFDGVLIVILTALTSFSVFLLLFSIAMED